MNPTPPQLFLRGPNGEQVIVHGTLSIGRDPRNGLALDSPGVSRRHAVLMATGGGLTIQDVGSSNGTFVNEQRTRGSTPLRSGDVVRVGDMRLRVESTAAFVPPPPARRGRSAIGVGRFNNLP